MAQCFKTVWTQKKDSLKANSAAVSIRNVAKESEVVTLQAAQFNSADLLLHSASTLGSFAFGAAARYLFKIKTMKCHRQISLLQGGVVLGRREELEKTRARMSEGAVCYTVCTRSELLSIHVYWASVN